MNKSLILICVILMVSSVANACAGITVKGSSGASYCLSKQLMNWYSAFAWCEAQGKKLIDRGTVCGKTSGNCTDLVLSSDEQNKITSNGGTVGGVWTNTSISSSHAWNVSLSSGLVFSNARKDNEAYALCY